MRDCGVHGAAARIGRLEWWRGSSVVVGECDGGVENTKSRRLRMSTKAFVYSAAESPQSLQVRYPSATAS